jgi:hypothetical protein
MGTRVDGYNVAFKVNEKDFIGVTNHDFDLGIKTKSSITKADQGVEKEKVTGNKPKFSVKGIAEVKSTGETTVLDRDEIIALAMAGTKFPYVYSASGAKSYSGTGMITGYTEGSGSDDELSYSIEVSGQSALALVTGE